MVIPSFSFVLQACLVWIGAVWIWRMMRVIRYRRTHPPLEPCAPGSQTPRVSVIVPARNEEKNIANCIRHLAAQTYPDYEIIVVDDRSDDQTGNIVSALAAQTQHPVRLVRIEKLPPGWTGKNHAMQVGSRAAGGAWLLFTDADTTHRPESLSTAVACVLARGIDFLTLAPETESKSFWEKTVQPLAVSSLAVWFDPSKINDHKNPMALANGQFLLVQKDVYEKIGGSEAVKNEVVEDVELAKKIRRAGFTVQFLNGTRLYSTRMYSSLAEIHKGWTRILTHLFEKNAWALSKKAVSFLFFSSLPFFVLLAETFWLAARSPRFDQTVFNLSLAVSCGIVTIRFLGNKMVKADPRYAVLHLLGSLVMVWILAGCVRRILCHQPVEWKGHAYA